jgi:competence protein ComEA
VGAGAALVLVLTGLGVAVLITAVTPHGTTAVLAGSQPPQTPVAGGASVIYVHILGQVANPGLYALRQGDRAVDIVAAAGGFTDQADPGGLNLARFLSDGEQIVVPAVGETPVSGPADGGKVNLNTADAAALETLPRIGPAMAQRILDWRETNGRFTSVDDLLDVPGIGTATLDGFRDLVTV